MNRRVYVASAGLGATEYATCSFQGYSGAAKAVQQMLRTLGATNIKADGYWGPCSDSAYTKIMGEPLSAASLQRLCIVCKSFVPGKSGTCSDGSDALDPGYTTPPIVGGDGGGPTTPPIMVPVLRTSAIKGPTTFFGSKRKTTFFGSKLAQPGTEQGGTLATLIPGVPDYAVMIGGALLVGFAAWFGYQKVTTGKFMGNARRGRYRSNPRPKVPTAMIDFVVGNLHVGVPDEEVRADIERRAKKSGRSEAAIRAWGDYAVKRHRANRKLYMDVMGGRIR